METNKAKPHEKQNIDENEEDSGLPFPRARVLRLMRRSITDGKQIRSEVKDALNIWLGNLVAKLSREMNNSPYGSIGMSDFQRATGPFDQIANLVKDEERLHLSLEKLKVDADQVQRDMRRFFDQIKGKEE